MADPLPYAKEVSPGGWFARRRTGSGTRMVAFAVLSLTAVALRYLTTDVAGNMDLHDMGKYLLIASCAGFALEYVVSFVG